ncbi:MAG: EAL domain-containing protein, partial [Rickettsiales bacterium]|nr:EAL domain-containing protein [Rickettsiales bacterium]
SNYWLFRHLTMVLDQYVLKTLAMRAALYFEKPVSINLNVRSILSENFFHFHDTISKKKKPSLVVEVDVADVFANMRSFGEARDTLHELGYRLCLDGLNSLSFLQISRESLGFDLAKLQWNADFPDRLNSQENKRLSEAIQTCGPNRLILCRAETKQAIEYGRQLGISVFQGRYVDSELDPDARIVN